MLSEIAEYLKKAGWLSVGTIAVTLLTVGSFFLTFAIVELSDPQLEIWKALLWSMLTSASVLTLTGGGLFWKALRGTATQSDQLEKHRRKQLLDKTKQLGGKVTVTELALESRYTIDQVRQDLEQMSKKDVARLEINDEGRELYRVPEFEKKGGEDELAIEIEKNKN